MFRRGVLSAALSIALVPAAAFAQAAPKQPAATTPPIAPVGAKAMPQQPSRFDQIDTNHDGFISRDEFIKAEKERFDEFDTNKDGKIDAKEVATSPQLMERNLRTAERMIKQWDANGDGIVTAEEFRKSSEDRFAKQDKEGTGKIARKVPPAGMQPMPKPMSKSPAPQPASPLLPAPPPEPIKH